MIMALEKISQNIFRAFLLLFIPVPLSAQIQNSIKTNATNTEIMYKMIEFQSEGATLRGRLYIPENKSENLAIVIMAHGYSATIEGMVADRYAEVI